MLQKTDPSTHVANETDRLSSLTVTFTHPDDVLHSRVLSLAEKRAVLAAWASDAHAVPNLPAMRQIDSGAIVSVDAIMAALSALDASVKSERPRPAVRSPWVRPRLAFMSRWRGSLRGRDGDDDDEPPPCSAAALPPGVELELRRRRDKAWKLAAA
jgi:hypothetical protein